MQSAAFKEDMPPQTKALFINHGKSHEMFMHLKAASNPLYAQQIQTQCPEFPVFTLPAPISSVPLLGANGQDPMAMMQSMANGSSGGSNGGPPTDPTQSPDATQTGESPSPGPETPKVPTPPTEQPDQVPVEGR
jgi:hypothetical protein